MHAGLKIGIGVGAAALVTGGIVAAMRHGSGDEAAAGDTGSGVRAVGPTGPGDEPLPYPGGDTGGGDEPISMPVRGTIDPPGIWNDYRFDGSLDGDRVRATIDPPGWGNDISLTGRVDYSGFDTRLDPRGWGNDTVVRGARTASGFNGTVDRPGLWNDVTLRVSETIRGASITREGRFDESLTPSFSEATYRSTPVGTGGGARVLEFNPPGWGNATRVTLEGNAPAGVEASIATHLFNEWKREQELQNDYPDPGYPSDPGYPTSPDYPGSPSYPGYPTGPGDVGSDVPTGPGDEYPTGPGDEYPIDGSTYDGNGWDGVWNGPFAPGADRPNMAGDPNFVPDMSAEAYPEP